MSNIHGKGAILYLGAAGAAAILIGENIDWSLDMDEAFAETTPLNNLWKTRVKGLMDYSLVLGGNYDPSSVQLFLAGTSTVVEKWYLYPQGSSLTTSYYYGTGWVQISKVAAGSTTAKASNAFKILGQGPLTPNQ